MKLSVKTIGAAPGLVESMEIEAQEIANALQAEISGNSSTALRASALTQDFIDRHEIAVRYASGTFLGFKIKDSALDEFETFKKY